jgi:uncharacterized membrane-anchored protein
MNLRTRLAIVFALHAIVLLYMIGDRQWTLTTGTPIALETLPVDPRSLFSGDFVDLNYRISELTPNTLAGDRVFRRHDSVYVVLRPGKTYWEPVSIHSRMPSAREGQVAVRGEVTHIEPADRDSSAEQRVQADVLHVRYGIESYFVPEGEGRAIERPAVGDTVTIRVAVDRRGRAAIKALLINGKEKYVERVF